MTRVFLWILLFLLASPGPGECFNPKKRWYGISADIGADGSSSTHKTITSDALLLVTKATLLDNPNPKLPDSTENINTIADDNLNISSLLTAYYGEDKARKREYEEAVESVFQGNAETDFGALKTLASAHFDSEQFAAGQARLINVRSQVTNLISRENYAEARTQAGGLLHTLQDFYSHSNWVEMGNTGTYDVLGKPGETDIPNVAPPNVPTCRDCESMTFKYACSENILSEINEQKLLTSGYYEGQVNETGHEIHKNETYMKCSHGGFLDGYRNTPARGGINKDSRNTILTYYTDVSLHTRAADLATKASVDILNDIRSDVSDDTKFLKFLGITTSTVTSIAYVIDTTGSMGDELTAIQAGIPEIRTRLQSYAGEVQDANLNYVLVPFNDPDPGYTFITQDAEEFLTAIGDLVANGGGDCPEPSFGALIRAIMNSEPGSPIYVFTDASASDEHLLSQIKALVNQRKNTISFFVTSGCSKRRRRESQSKFFLHRRQATGLDLYNYLATLSGGQVLSGEAADISELSLLISQSSQTLRSTIFFQLGSSSVSQVLAIPVDVTMDEVLISITGVDLVVQVQTPTGPLVLTEASMGNEIALQTSTTFIAVLNVSSQAAGDSWNITLTSLGPYSVEVSALSSLSFQQYLYVLDTTNSVPDISSFEGRPTAGVPIVFNIVVIGSIQEVAEFSSVAVLDSSSGDALDIVNITGAEGDYFGVFLPPQMQTFQLQLLGKDLAGNTISRISSVTFETTTIDLQLGSGVPGLISCMPGEATEVDVFLYNMGESSTFGLSITSNNDEFNVTITPSQLTLAANDTGNATITIAVPMDSTTGDSVTISVVASSTTDERTDFTSFQVVVSLTPPVNVTSVFPEVNTSALFQLELQLPENTMCEDWLRNDRLSGTTTELLVIIGTLCSCEFTEDNVNVSEISCRNGSDAVLIRGTTSYVTSGDTYSAIELRSLLSDWVQNGTRTLTVDGTVLSVDSTCPVPLESLQDMACITHEQPEKPTTTVMPSSSPPPPTSDEPSQTPTSTVQTPNALVWVGVGVGVAIAVVLVVFVLVIVVVAVVVKRRPKFYHPKNIELEMEHKIV